MASCSSLIRDSFFAPLSQSTWIEVGMESTSTGNSSCWKAPCSSFDVPLIRAACFSPWDAKETLICPEGRGVVVITPPNSFLTSARIELAEAPFCHRGDCSVALRIAEKCFRGGGG